MNEKNLVICDREIRYANSLGENISGREELAVKVYVCSNVEKVIELSKEKQIHIFVVDETYPFHVRKQVEASQVFVLGRGKVADLGDGERQVGKYQCANRIIREIFETYIDKTKEDLTRCMRKDRAKIVAVYSPLHRLGKTSFAIALGKEHAKRKRVLYINLEEYAGMEVNEELNLGDLFYYIRQGNGNLGIRLQAAVGRWEQLDYLAPIPISKDLKEVSEKEWRELLEEITESSVYELLILDISESVQGLWNLLEQCDRVYMPILEDEVSQRKIEQYNKNLEQLRLEKLKRITCRFVMPEQVEEYAKIRAKEDI